MILLGGFHLSTGGNLLLALLSVTNVALIDFGLSGPVASVRDGVAVNARLGESTGSTAPKGLG